MASRYNWTNEDGLVVNTGRRTSDNQAAGKVSTMGSVQEVEFVVPEGEQESAATQSYSAVIPAGAVIRDVKLFADGALTSLANLTVGIKDADGGSGLTDANGLVLAIDAAEVLGLEPSGSVVGTAFDGAFLVASAGPLSEAVEITWVVGTPSSAGNIRGIVEYTMAR